MADIMDLVMGGADDSKPAADLPAVNPIVESSRPDNSNKIPFSYLCKLFERIEAARARSSNIVFTSPIVAVEDSC